MKECQFCKELIDEDALVCQYCLRKQRLIEPINWKKVAKDKKMTNLVLVSIAVETLILLLGYIIIMSLA